MIPKHEQAATVRQHRTAHRKAPHQQRQDTKKAVILAILKSGESMNRLEAERNGDHCLHSTVAALRGEGYVIIDRWESVPTRFGKETRVKRYSYGGGVR